MVVKNEMMMNGGDERPTPPLSHMHAPQYLDHKVHDIPQLPFLLGWGIWCKGAILGRNHILQVELVFVILGWELVASVKPQDILVLV